MRIVDRWQAFRGWICFIRSCTDWEGETRTRISAHGRMRFLGVLRMIKLKRVYEEEAPVDRVRYLVERLWPRGVQKESLHFDGWLKMSVPARTAQMVQPRS
jgi:hypothetical protein